VKEKARHGVHPFWASGLILATLLKLHRCKKSLRLPNPRPWINSPLKYTRTTLLRSRSKLLKGFTFHASQMELWWQTGIPLIPGKAFKFTSLTTAQTKVKLIKDSYNIKGALRMILKELSLDRKALVIADKEAEKLVWLRPYMQDLIPSVSSPLTAHAGSETTLTMISTEYQTGVIPDNKEDTMLIASTWSLMMFSKALALPSKVHTPMATHLRDGSELPEMEHSSVIVKSSTTFPNCSTAGQTNSPN
jgi:hypothetical protein